MRLQAVVSTSACNSSIRWWLVGLSRKAKQNEYSGRWCACMAFLLLAAAFFFSSCSRACTCIPLVVCEECHMYTLAVHNLTSHVSCTCSFFLRTSIPFSSPVKASETGIWVTSFCCAHKLLLCQTRLLPARNLLVKVYVCHIQVVCHMCSHIRVYLLTGPLLYASVSLKTSKIQCYTAKEFACALLETSCTASWPLFSHQV